MFNAQRFLFFVALVVTIFTASGTSQIAVPDPGFRIDKPAHFLIFGLIATALLRSLSTRVSWPNWKRILVVTLVVSAIGALDEFRQSFTPGRFPEVADWVADTAGALLAVLVYTYWPLYRRTLEWRPFAKKRAPAGEPSDS